MLTTKLAVIRRALKPFATFAEKWAAHPISGLSDDLYCIHSGREQGVLRLSDCRRAARVLADLEFDSTHFDRRLHVYADGRAEFPGIDFSGKLRVHHDSGDVIVLKKASGSCWAGLGARADYVPATFRVYAVLARTTSGDHAVLDVEPLVDFPVKKKTEDA